MRAVDQWREIESGLDPEWDVAVLRFVPEDDEAIGRAAGILGPLGPLRRGRELRLQVASSGASPDRLQRLLRHLDRERVWGVLELVETQVERAEPPAEAPPPAANGERPLAEQWDDEIAKLPPGWRDLLAELELDSTDFLAQAALAGSPLNPSRVPGETALRFRVVSIGVGGYGAPPELVRRCLERMDAAGVTGRLTVETALSDVDYVGTQGPVWRIAGRSV